jgi:hypothetical protein
MNTPVKVNATISLKYLLIMALIGFSGFGVGTALARLANAIGL